MESLASGTHRPSRRRTEEVSNPAPPGRAAMLVRRYESGRDPSTGKLLVGDDARAWLRHWAGFKQSSEEPWWPANVAGLLGAQGDTVSYLSTDCTVWNLKRTRTKVRDEDGKTRRHTNVEVLSVTRNATRAPQL